MSAASNLDTVATRIETLIDELAALANPQARDAGEQLVELLMRFYGAGLTRVLEIVDEEPPADARRIFERFASDELVASLLVLHGLHPVTVETRVAAALEHLAPRLDTPGELTLVDVDADVARVRVRAAPQTNGNGHGHGGGHSAAATKRSVEQAVAAAAPEIARVIIDGLDEEAPALVQLTRARA
jgi:hypothetical protein